MSYMPHTADNASYLWHSPNIPPLIQAICEKREDYIIRLLRVLPSAYINIHDGLRRTPLHAAVAIGSSKILHLLLLRKEIDIEARDHEDCTALHMAIQKCSLELVQVLLYHGADANARCSKFFEQTPLLMCLNNSCDQIAMELLDYVCDFNILDVLGNTALYYALTGESELSNDIIRRRGEADLDPSILLLSLYQDNNRAFTYCWPRTKYRHMYTRMFSILLSNQCKFSNRDWLQTILTIFEPFEDISGLSIMQRVNLCEKCYDYRDHHLIPNLLRQLSHRFIAKQDRYTLIYTFLSNGVHPRGLSLYNFHDCYNYSDKEEMLHVLVQAGYDVDDYLQNIRNDTHPFTVILFMKYTKLSLNYILGRMLQVRMYALYNQLKAIEILTQFCTPNAQNRDLYFTIFRERFAKISYLHENCTCLDFISKTMTTEGVPSLLELSRDAVRKLIGRKYKTSCSFCCVVRDLALPQEIRQLVLLARCLRNQLQS